MIMLLVPAVQSCVSRAIQSDRVLDIPVMLTVQFLNKVVDMVFDCCPWSRQCSSFIDKVVDIPGSEQWKVLRLSYRQSSMTFLRRFWPIFRTPPKGVESRVARIFRALDDEEFFVVEGSSGLALTPGVHSQVLGRRV